MMIPEILRRLAKRGVGRVFWILFFGTATAAAPAFDYDTFLKSVHVPPQFELELAAGEPLIRFPMFACLDDQGALYVAESSGHDLYAGLKQLARDCRVSRLEDADGDGRFEKAGVFQAGVTFPMGLAWHEGRLYLADPPNLVALTDTDGDSRADRRDVILSGFGHNDNGSLHGLCFGPDGLLYFTMGEPDGWKLPRGDGTFLEGVAGALFRCRPDGSKPEVVSRGFENLVEVEFLPGGEIVGTDNWYQKPAGGLRDALIDCAPGGLYPYAPDRGTPLPRTGLTLPALTLLPAVAHSGLTRLQADRFPAEWRNGLYVAEHNSRKVVRHDLGRAGSSFNSTQVDFVVGEHPDFHPSDVLEDADGSLLVVDTGGWYVEHCPTGRIRESRAPGGLYRVRWGNAPKNSDPRGRTMTWNQVEVLELTERLRDPRPAVAEHVASELVRRRETAALSRVLNSGEKLEVRLRALWALGRVSGAESLAVIRSQLAAADLMLVTAAARVLAHREDRAAGDSSAGLLQSPAAPVRRAAAEALAVCGSRSHAPQLVTALVAAGDDFERHACIAALLAVADEVFVRKLLRHDSPHVRSAALHLLDQPPFSTLRFPDLLAPLADPDPRLSTGARRLVARHPDWADETLPWLREQLATPKLDDRNKSALGNLLLAFQSAPAVRHLISDHLTTTAPNFVDTRAFLLNLLPTLTAHGPDPAWVQAILPALMDPDLRGAGLNVAAAFAPPQLSPVLGGLAENPTLPVSQRFRAARLSAQHPGLSQSVFALSIRSLSPTANVTDRLGALDLLAHAHLLPAQFRDLLAAAERSPAIPLETLLPALFRSANGETRPLLAKFVNERLQAGWSPTRAILDPLLNLYPADAPIRATLLAKWESNQGHKLQRLAEFKPLLTGGNADRGRANFDTSTCSGCHRIGARGGELGPDLTRIGAIRSGDDLLESILYPSSTFAQGYEPYQLIRRNGDEITGHLISQGPEGVSLRDTAGFLHHVRSADLASLDRLQSSAMPEGLEQLLTRDQFRDLLAYLQSLK